MKISTRLLLLFLVLAVLPLALFSSSHVRANPAAPTRTRRTGSAGSVTASRVGVGLVDQLADHLVRMG